MDCRALLVKLEQRGYIALPPRQPFSGKGHRKVFVPEFPNILDEIIDNLRMVRGKLQQAMGIIQKVR